MVATLGKVEAKRRWRVLVVSRAYPNNVLTGLGLWVIRLVSQCTETCEIKVVSPVQYCPPLTGFSEYTRFRGVVRNRSDNGVEVFYPRFVVGPGRSLYPTEAILYYLGVRRQVDAIRRTFDFDIIHAHFSYPDGVAAALLGRRYGVPVVITEHAPWKPNWIDKSSIVRRQAVWAAKQSVFQIAVSRSVRDSIAHFTGQPEKIRIIHCGVDGSDFDWSQDAQKTRRKDRVLFVGFINFNKGIDVLLESMRQIVARRPGVKLLLIGGGFYANTKRQEERLREMAKDLEASGHVEFLGHRPPHEVARYMRESTLLVLPSRAESFGGVLVEALACGTPVVATECGGPEDIVNPQVGLLVPPEDSVALALAIERVLERTSDYDPAAIRAYALEHFSWERIAQQTTELYREALDRFQAGVTTAEGRNIASDVLGLDSRHSHLSGSNAEEREI